jgi:hypothetical protein
MKAIILGVCWAYPFCYGLYAAVKEVFAGRAGSYKFLAGAALVGISGIPMGLLLISESI